MALEGLIDERASLVGPDGNIYTRADDLAAHSSGHQRMTRVDEESLAVHTFGGTVGITYFLGTVAGTVGGEPFLSRMRYTRTWQHDGQRWRVIAAHVSPGPT